MILTSSGNFIDPFNLKEQDILIQDIACSLAGQPRFSGHTGTTYSVAEHSVITLCSLISNCSIILLKPEILKQALMHDAPEAYISDIPGPIKDSINKKYDNAIQNIEEEIWKVIASKYSIPVRLKKEVLIADKEALAGELVTFFSEGAIVLKDHLKYKGTINHLYEIINKAIEDFNDITDDHFLKSRTYYFLSDFFRILIPNIYSESIDLSMEPLSKEDAEYLFLETWKLLNLM